MNRAAAAVVTVLLLGAGAGCGDSEASSVQSPSPAAQETTAADCRDLLPSSAVDALGWTGASTPTLDSATCTLTTAEGEISVQRRPVPGTNSDDLPAAAEKAFDERCAELDQGAAGEEVDWLGADTPACAVAPAEGAAVSTLLAIPRPGLLVEVTVSTDRATDAAAVQDALVDVEQAAAEHL